ncbi:hypothetical protein BH20VER2_BH20VER2_18990 [soil metagenome]|nr:hypothetical protein [Chthoniobacterales bacterium]
MKVASKSPRKSPPSPAGRATVTLSAETYRKVDELRGEHSRSAWIQRLVDREEERRARDELAEVLREQYTPAVAAETLVVNEEFPIHDT